MEFVTGGLTQTGYSANQFHDGKSLDDVAKDLAGIVRIKGTAFLGWKIH